MALARVLCPTLIGRESELSTLEDAGYVHIDRPLRDRRRRVRARLTAAGATAFQGHVAALREIVETTDPDRALA